MLSVIKGEAEPLMGDIIGADILNVLSATGAAATAWPLPIVERGSAAPEIFLWLHPPLMLAALGLFRLYIFRATRTGHFRRWIGIPLRLLYGGYAVGQCVLSR